jgi:translation initiation factor 1
MADNSAMARSTVSQLVYSTEHGRICPDCREPVARCACRERAAAALPAGDGIARVSRETKGRGGKAVTVVRGLALKADDLVVLGKRLRAACGAGGTCKDGVLEIQGDHAAKVVDWLIEQGLRAKRAGG